MLMNTLALLLIVQYMSWVSGENLVTAFDIFFRRQNKWFILKWSQMQYFKQFVKERQEIKPLRTCEPYFMTLKKIY